MSDRSFPVWHFAERGFNDVEQEVTEGDQFNNETVENVEALIREATQNSQDAASSNIQPVRVRIAIVDRQNGLDVDFLAKITSEVRARIKASGLAEDADAINEPRVLLIEDFGTEGLTGKVDAEADQGNWRSFFFRHGGSFKSGGKNGRWGLGKLVFPMFSGARCFFGFTIRKDENAPLVLGQAVLRTHRIHATKYAPHGHYGRVDNKRVLPVMSEEWISKFRTAFAISRTSEPGLSVVVPFPLQGADHDKLLGFVVKNYAYPILTHRLIVDVLGTKIDANNLKEIGHLHLDNELIDFIERVHSTGPEGLSHLIPGAKNELDESVLGKKLDDFRARYSAGELLGFRIGMRVDNKSSGKTSTYVDVFIKAAKKPEAGEAIFVRGDITVPGEAAARFKTKGAYAALIAREEAISAFLADAENPAHTHWSAQADRLKQNWRNPNLALKLVRNAPSMLHRLLASGKDHEDETALIDLFSVPDTDSPHRGTSPTARKKKDKKTIVEVTPPPLRPKRILLNKRPGGFSLKPGPGFDSVELPTELRILIAYDVERGNAVKSWDRLDFSLDDEKGPSVSCNGGEFERAGNEIVFRIVERQFELMAEGFDVRRDLVVDCSFR